MTYVCPTCGVEAQRAGECDLCHAELEKMCEGCGELESQCVCQGPSDDGEGELSREKEEG